MLAAPKPVRQFLEALRDGGPWFRRGVITGLGTVCVAVAALWIGHAWQTRPPPAPKVVGKPLVIIDGPPTNVKPAPPPPALPDRPRLAEGDEDADDGPGDAQAGPAVAQPAVDQGAQRMQARTDSCAALANPADRVVCASPRLSAADDRLHRLYRLALNYSSDPEAVRDEQRRWSEVRDRVAASGDPQALDQLYDERINELSGPG